ncbi:hypothetical protein B0H13DRAFT_1867631 [Mycena leptocephala]|nr:hypothetical protein B0H13DRAFT_1867631 [Mycena leptocephala]
MPVELDPHICSSDVRCCMFNIVFGSQPYFFSAIPKREHYRCLTAVAYLPSTLLRLQWVRDRPPSPRVAAYLPSTLPPRLQVASAFTNRRNGRTSTRVAEDFSQVGILLVRKHKLKPEALSVSEVKAFAQSLKIAEILAGVNTGAVNTTLTKKLALSKHKIDVHTFRTMMLPTLGYYVKKAGGDSPSSIMKVHL